MGTPIKLRIEYWKYDDSEVLRPNDIELNLSNKVLFSFMETDNVWLKFDFNENEYSIFLEPYDESDYIKVTSGNRFKLSSGREELGCYFPGYFNVQISSNGELQEYLFFVKPKNLFYENVVEIRNYVNDFYFGLSRDLLKKKRNTSGTGESNDTPNINDNTAFLSNNMPSIINIINLYVRDRNAEIEKKRLITRTGKRLNGKSMRWLSQKGMSKNENPNSPELVMTTKALPNLNNRQNQIFKRELLFWNNELARSIQILKKYKANVSDRTAEIEKQIKDNSDLLQQARSEKKVSKNVIITAEKKEERLTKDLSSLKAVMTEYDNTLGRLKQYKISLEFILYNSWIRDVKEYDNIQAPIMNVKLKMLMLYKNEYMGIKRIVSKNKTEKIGYAEKCTPKLFETYTYILLINILREQGYELENINAETNDLLFILSNASTISMTNGDKYCDIYYDLELKKSTQKFSKSEYCTVSSRHNRPDFILSFKDNEGNLENTVVVETKWRGINQIYSEVGDTDVVENLRDYFNLAYHDVEDKRTPTHRGVVNKVIVLYPDAEERNLEIQDNEIIAVGIMPSGKAEESKGYQSLKREIVM